jgi:hypothetical protein
VPKRPVGGSVTTAVDPKRKPTSNRNLPAVRLVLFGHPRRVPSNREARRSSMKIFLTWAAIGSVAGAVLGFVGLLSYDLIFDRVSDADSRAWQDSP